MVVKTSLTGPIQVAHYAALALEVPVYRQLAIQAEGIYIYKYVFNAARLAPNRNSLGAKLDVKYYIPKSTTLRIYTGPGITYRNMYTQEGRIVFKDGKDEFGNDIDIPYVEMDNASEVKTSNTDIVWQVGIQPLIFKHFALNLYTGTGLGLIKQKVTSGPELSKYSGVTKTYLSTIVGLQVGFAF